jgi:hypothetical protein
MEANFDSEEEIEQNQEKKEEKQEMIEEEDEMIEDEEEKERKKDLIFIPENYIDGLPIRLSCAEFGRKKLTSKYIGEETISVSIMTITVVKSHSLNTIIRFNVGINDVYDPLNPGEIM